jgi:hypothetical protein
MVDRSYSASDLEQLRHALATELEDRKRAHSVELTMLKAQTDFANAGLRAVVLANGGALVAVLALAGQLAKEADGGRLFHFTGAALAGSLTWFVGGLACGVGGYFLAFVAQLLLTLDPRRRRWYTRPAWWLATVVPLAGLALFLAGAFALSQAALQ